MPGKKTTISYKVVKESFSEKVAFEQRFKKVKGASLEATGEREF